MTRSSLIKGCIFLSITASLITASANLVLLPPKIAQGFANLVTKTKASQSVSHLFDDINLMLNSKVDVINGVKFQLLKGKQTPIKNFTLVSNAERHGDDFYRYVFNLGGKDGVTPQLSIRFGKILEIEKTALENQSGLISKIDELVDNARIASASIQSTNRGRTVEDMAALNKLFQEGMENTNVSVTKIIDQTDTRMTVRIERASNISLKDLQVGDLSQFHNAFSRVLGSKSKDDLLKNLSFESL